MHRYSQDAGPGSEDRSKKLADAVVWPLLSKLTCAECKIEAKKLGYEPDCGECDYTGLMIQNLEAFQVFNLGGEAILDREMNINLMNAKLVCETLGYLWDDAMMRKLIYACGEYSDEVLRQRRHREGS